MKRKQVLNRQRKHPRPEPQLPAPPDGQARWARTQRYGWDKGGNRGGRR